MRQESGFRRDYAGRVYLQARDGSFYLLRTDAKLPGTVLMRAPDGRVFYMSFNDIQQVDLSDDFVVSGIFGAGAAWEEEMQPLQAKAKDGSMTDVRMKQENFEDMISIISAPD